jgi:hypothetical protein
MTDISKIIGKKWKDLSGPKREPWEELARVNSSSHSFKSAVAYRFMNPRKRKSTIRCNTPTTAISPSVLAEMAALVVIRQAPFKCHLAKQHALNVAAAS